MPTSDDRPHPEATASWAESQGNDNPDTHAPDSNRTQDDVPGARRGSPDPAASLTEGLLAGRYRLGDEIARGGMGMVVRAIDTVFDREVAVKLLLADPAVAGPYVDRFRHEARLTARLQHPGVPPVHDLGTLPDGRPFLAMKLIQGRTLAALLKERSSPSEDLPRWVQVFEQIAQTVGYAHAQGIIHRDLKPLNVMVGAFGEVQVMDWGLAKELGTAESPSATIADTDDPELRTQSGTVMGTPAYMAPEQARGEIDRIDRRADVFALGAMLCQILTRRPPYSGRSSQELLLKAARADLGETPESLRRCGADAELVDLALGCLAANPEDRLADAATVARLVADYRAAVDARLRRAETERAQSETRLIEQRKRRRVWIGLAAVLLVGVITSTVLAILSDHAADAERSAKRSAEKRLAQVEKANDILGSIFENLDPKEIARAERPLQAILLDKLDRAVEQLEGEAIGDPLIVAAMQRKFGLSLLGLGAPGKAIMLFEKARTTYRATLGPDHPDTLTSMNDLASGYRDAGKLDLALPLFEETLKLRKAKLGPNHPHTLRSMGNLASGYRDAGKLDLALPLHEETLNLMKAKLGPDHPDTLTSMNNLAAGYKAAGKLDLALPLLEQTLKLTKAKRGPDHPDTHTSMNNLAAGYWDAGKLDLALPLLEHTLKLKRAKLGPDHPDTLSSMGNLAWGYLEAGKLDLALPLLEETLKLRRAKLGPDHPDTLNSMGNLAWGYQEPGKLDLALPLCEETLKLKKAKLGPDHPDTLTTMSNLAAGYKAAGKLDLALPLFEETLKLRKARLGPDHLDTLTSMNNLAAGYWAAGKLDLALPLLEHTLKLRKAKLGPDHPDTLTSMNALAWGYRAAGKVDLALPLLEETLTLSKAKLGPDHPQTLVSMGNLALGYQDTGKVDLALALFEETLKLRKAKLGPDHPDTLTSMNNLAAGYWAAGKLDLALPLLEHTLKLGKAKLGPDHPDTLTNMGNLAAAYRTAGRLPQAIELFEQVRDAELKKLGADHPSTLTTLGNLAGAYQAAGKRSQAIDFYEQAATGVEKRRFLHEHAEGIIRDTIRAYEAAKQLDKAESWRRKWLAVVKAEVGTDAPAYAGEMAALAQNLLQRQKWTDAETILRESLAIRERKEPDAWTTFNTKSMLGAALLGQKKYADAAPLLIKGYEGMKEREDKIPPQGKPRLTEALERLVQLYDAWDKPAEAAKWRKELEARKAGHSP